MGSINMGGVDLVQEGLFHKVRKFAATEMTLAIRTSFIAVHFWKEAPAEQYYLAYPHRHVFNVIIYLELNPHVKSRYLEFHAVQTEMKAFVDAKFSFHRSGMHEYGCEDFARQIADWGAQTYGHVSELRGIRVYVDEDGEHGAICSLAESMEKL